MIETMNAALKRKFTESKMNIRQLSTRSGVSYASTYETIKNNKNPQLYTFERLADVLGLELIETPDHDTANHGVQSP